LLLEPDIRERGYLTKNDLNQVAKWKAPRSAGHVQKNDPEYVIEVSRITFTSRNERLRIESLTLLDGVSWPTASVILHLFHPEPYPILDFRALWSISVDVPTQYNFEFWWNYTEYCRDLAVQNQVDMRTLDRALWQYSKQNQINSGE
jgi:hypothetical protein